MDFPTCVYKLELLLSSFQTSTGGNVLPSEKYGLFPLPYCVSQEGLGGDARAKWPGLRCFCVEERQDRVRGFTLANGLPVWKLESAEMKDPGRKEEAGPATCGLLSSFQLLFPLGPAAEVTVGTR